MLDKDTVAHLASLARIALSPDEQERLVKDLGGILEYVSEISAVVTQDVGPVPGDLRGVMRDDAASEGGKYTADLLANAPETEKGYFKVRSIL